MYLVNIILSFLRDNEYRKLLLITSIIIGFGTTFYHYIEGWSWIDAAYFSVITLTTIGYGDFSPATDLGKLFTIGYIVIGVGVILGFINAVYHHYKSQNQK
ncbi:MAG: two pore domain potassium channel family protein [Flavobacteriaceae bacterium]|jgi:voltage-gated potassium channel|nr:two pore domain potassium channel family protein [Candidatus Arcticimaribacter sp.]